MFSVGLDKLLIFIFYSQRKCNNKQLGFSTLVSKNNNKYLKEVLFGSLLGDGKAELCPRAKNARFGFIQGEPNKEYFLFLLNILGPLGTIKYREYSYLDKRTGKIYNSLNFWTKSLPLITEIYNNFYSNKKKIVPNDLSLLTPIALAHWIMQDGSKGTSGGLYICTDNFTKTEVKYLINYIKIRYAISCSIHTVNGRYRIYVLVKSIPTVREIIIPHMHHSMLYKLEI